MSERKGCAFFLLGIIALAFASISFAAGFGLGKWQNNSWFEQHGFSLSNVNATEPMLTGEAQPDTDLFWEVWNEVQDNYIGQPVDDAELFYGAVEGIAQSVDDPYTVYMNPEDAKDFQEIISGKFEGIGAEIGMKEGQLVVIAPLAGTPADAAGLLADDAIIKIDGTDTTGLTIDEAITKIRGPKGTTVTLTIYRNGDVDFKDIAIVRDTIQVKTATYATQERNGKTVGILTISHVDEKTYEETQTFVQTILLEQPAGLILDLRNNPGGLLSECIDLSSIFIEDGTIVSEQFSDGKVTTYDAVGDAALAEAPAMVVLVNEGSASAAEIIAGALQDYGRATVIGQTTYGKGSVQDYKEYSDGSSLKLTVAKWLTPHGRTIDKIGITPDVVVDLTVEDYIAGRDPQLDAALDYLTK